MSHTLSTSFHYAPEVVDLEAMNITEMFPEASSFSFDMSSSYNHSYSDSISGVPLAQQALWDDGQLSLSAAVNSSRGQYQYHGSPLKGDNGYPGHEDGEQQDDQGHYDDYDESSLQHGWMDETRDQNGILLLNDKEHQDEQHLMFLQDIGATGNLSRGDNSISLFAKLADESDLSCDLFKEELDADETRDHSRLQFEHGSGMDPLYQQDFGTTTGFGGPGKKTFENEIFDQEFMASLRTPTFAQSQQSSLESSRKRNFFEGLHTISVATTTTDDNIAPDASQFRSMDRQSKSDAYQQALKSFFDSLKIADPIKTPHKFAPQPLPILWNEPKIRSKALPSFSLADYKDLPKTTTPTITSTNNNSTKKFSNTASFSPPATITPSTTVATAEPDKLGSLLPSSLPNNQQSIRNSALSSPMSSLSTTPPTAINNTVSNLSTPKTPTTTARILSSASPYGETQLIDNKEIEKSPPQQPLKPESSSTLSSPKSERGRGDRSKRRPTISNPHLAFDPTIPPSERERVADENRTDVKSVTRGTMEQPRRSSTLLQQQQLSKVKAYSAEQEDKDNDSETPVDRRTSPTLNERQGSLSGLSSPGGLKGPVIRKRRSLHQDMFFQEQAAGVEGSPVTEQQQDEDPKETGQDQGQQEPIARRGSRPLSVNILPESLTSVNNHAIHQDSTNIERIRRLSEEEGGNIIGESGGASSRIPGTLSLGRAAGTRYGRSSSNASGGSATTQLSPTTPTTTNPYGSLAGRTPGRQSSQRLSASGLSGMYTRPESQQRQYAAEEAQSPSRLPAPLPPLGSSSAVLSRNGSRSSPPSTFQSGLRRPGGSTMPFESEFQKDFVRRSSTDYYDDFPRSERGPLPQQLQSPSRLSYPRQHEILDREGDPDHHTEWYEKNEQDVMSSRRSSTQMVQPPKTGREPLLTRRRSSLEQQREQHQLQRLRIQQQAREEVYGRAGDYRNEYADMDHQRDFAAEDYSMQSSSYRFNQPFEHQQQQQQLSHQKRNSAVYNSPPRDYGTTSTTPVTPTSVNARTLNPSAASAIRSSPTMSPSSQTTREHYRRQSRDGHTLMPAPRISPPPPHSPLQSAPTASMTTRIASGSNSNGLAPRRSLSNVGGSLGVSSSHSRRLSTAANIGSSDAQYESSVPSSPSTYGNNSGGLNRTSSITGPIHGRSISSSGSGFGMTTTTTTTTSPRSTTINTYSGSPGVGSGGFGGHGRSASSTTDRTTNLPPPRRAASTMISSPTRRASGATSTNNSGAYRASTIGHSASSSLSSSSEYARVFVPPRSAGVSGGSSGGGSGYGANSNSSRNLTDESQHQDAYSNYRPEVPTRHSSLGSGIMAPSNGAGIRSSLATPPRSSGSTLSGTSSSSSQLRRASSMNVNASNNPSSGGGGLGAAATLGRSSGSGLLSSRQQYQPQQPQGQQTQRYQRTSTYGYRA
ncbi:hypothetical protein BGX28_003642 [Mortierella sp. GBA30]|nr:hypothetical protein BGX28_003642 [Mortierella sp. GBA30]